MGRAADSPWRGPESELGGDPNPRRRRSPLVHHALVGALVLSIFVQLFLLALLSSLLETADAVARAPHFLYDPEDQATFTFVIGVAAELMVGNLVGALWTRWLAERLPPVPPRPSRFLLAVHNDWLVQFIAPWAAFAALDRSGALVPLRRAWLVAWTLMLVAFLGPLFSARWVEPLRAAWCAPRGLGLSDGNDWCRWALESWVHAGGAVAAIVAANVAILLVRKLRHA